MSRISEIEARLTQLEQKNEAILKYLQVLSGMVNMIPQDLPVPPFNVNVWKYPDRALRFAAHPNMLLIHPELIALMAYADKIGIPNETLPDGTIRYYPQELMNEHQAMLQNLGITIEQRPSIPEP
jgi:hypothetical protein